jgi:tetratricopeptide (TPR) repeat protein
MGNTSGALQSYRRSFDEWQAVVSLDSRNPRNKRALATLSMKLADVQDATGDWTAAQANYRAALAALEDLPDSNEVALRRLAGMLHRKLGVSLAESGDTRGGLQSLEWASEIFSTLAKADPSDQRARSDLANVWLSIGDTHYRANETGPAISALAKAVNAFEQLAQADPSNQSRRDQYVYALLRAGAVLNAAGQKDEARRQTGRALNMAKQSADRPEAAAAELERAARYFMGCQPPDLRQAGLALRYAKRAVELTHSENLTYLATLAEAQLEAGDRAAAVATAKRAIEAATQGSPERAELQSRLKPITK